MRAAFVAGVVFGVALLSACGSPVVGARCREGQSICGAACVDLANDVANCGACGIVCADGRTCSSGMCVLPFDAGAPDADAASDAEVDAELLDAEPMDAPRDAQPTDAEPRDAQRSDAGPGVCDLGEVLCGEACVDPATDPMHCGGCDLPCPTGEVCQAGVCAPTCDAPFIVCSGLCIDPRNDPDRCGECGRRCTSGVCEEGMCVLGTVGHVVLVGHDYRASRPGMNRLAGNAVFLGRGAPVRALVYEGEPDDRAVMGIEAAVNQVAMTLGRTWDKRATIALDVPFRLRDADVFVIYPQQTTTNEQLRELGRRWSLALATFLERGGVIVLFDGSGTSVHDGTWQILDEAGVFEATASIPTTGSVITLTAPGDAVALGVPLNYLAEANSVRFETPDPYVVARDAVGPVVIHRVVATAP